MRKFIALTVLATVLPLGLKAQDDMYFTPKMSKAEAKAEEQREAQELEARRRARMRDVDEYNRHGFSSYYQTVDSDGSVGDTISFGDSFPSDSVANLHDYQTGGYSFDDDDYSYSRRLSRFDDFFWYASDPWFWDYDYYGVYDWRWGWPHPWRYGWTGWYDPWCYGYAGWYGSWRYGWGGWYDPWYYGGWGRPYWGNVIAYRPVNRNGYTGTSNHGSMGHGGAFRGGRDVASSRNRGDFRNGNTNTWRGNDSFNRNNDDWARSRDNSQQVFRNESTFRNNSGNSSFSQSRGGGFSGGGFSGGGHGGGFSGGGRSGGGGHFGSRR